MFPKIGRGSVVVLKSDPTRTRYRVVARANRVEPRMWWLRSFANMAARKAARERGVDNSAMDGDAGNLTALGVREDQIEPATLRAPLEVVAEVETKDGVMRELERVEIELADRLGMPRSALPVRIPAMLRSGEIAEDALIARWLVAYTVAMEYS